MTNDAAATPFVSLNDVSVAFATTSVLAGVSLDISSGEVVGIIGRSGAGKSTLLRVIAGLIEPNSGVAAVDGVPAKDARKLRRFGFMPQSPALFPWFSVRRNVALLAPGGESNTQLDRALELVGLANRADDLPETLSGGMRHRAALARAVATGAPVLLLDEPFSAVDEYTRDELYRELMAIVEQGAHTVVFVTHSILEAVLLSDRVLVLGDSPARLVAEVRIDEPRPRVNALDEGRLAQSMAELRAILRDDPS